ncbi:hypothetical protein LPW11_20805 [Geomonas sp. RF6]|uniref:hypothetical protein n=1 Tax=Geomonas sp. RF6 TaxID=2897342 RepID=UPI001E382841|nr:hypothetical protein [Geomonas sp. RF6]UFS70301.1 hypothetical protein LPW11_20805 [Geomonas sp. RF6]
MPKTVGRFHGGCAATAGMDAYAPARGRRTSPETSFAREGNGGAALEDRLPSLSCGDSRICGVGDALTRGGNVVPGSAGNAFGFPAYIIYIITFCTTNDPEEVLLERRRLQETFEALDE